MPARPKHRKTQTPAMSRRRLLVAGGVLAAGTLLEVSGYAADATASSDSDRTPDRRKAREAAGRRSGHDMPRIRTRADWNARPAPAPRLVREAPKFVVVHHTATPNVDDFSLEQAYRLSRSIQSAHMGVNGWPDTGQHFTISRGGHIMEGRQGSIDAARRGFFVEGTHAGRANDFTVGIECEGTYSDVLPPEPLLASLTETLAWLCRQYDLDPREAIVPHRHFSSTECCGTAFAAALPNLRGVVEDLLG
ncbi:peptidoglycan recognition protein family protein [Thermomonospora cellulosilytica]|uniref:N-acetylmuramoyl-L-alanine amidase n=1 Tax=Thermomonospora cellulosilytica TaxID=1411118 RepID=A0A7W3N2L1_9ACTN|nr:peptidoglycan recognition family protein [Thermomonospora cellulosilytica]MBA9006333.1 hypothetical protein [Thermomonospora cellulosilytica]